MEIDLTTAGVAHDVARRKARLDLRRVAKAELGQPARRLVQIGSIDRRVKITVLPRLLA